MKWPPALFFFFIFLFLIVLVIYQQFPEQSAEQPKQESPQVLCSPGERLSCTIGECEGFMECQNGFFSPCILDAECTIGEEEFCALDACSYGKRKCNECGKWGECLPQ
ncbi:hypothetical protein KAW38_02260 [Candidatus Micrarchaeota archaeon]|nr:hypothetical protein [Candidatus Micrarchaeota archaeon]